MKQTLLAALLAAIAASALTLLLTTGLSPAPAGATAAEFKSALSELVGEVAALRREMAGGRAAAQAPVLAPVPGTAAAGADRLPPVPAPGAPEMTLAAPAEGEASAVPAPEEFLPPKERSALQRSAELADRIRGLSKWEDSAEIRGKWILASEEAVLNTFGKPDEIYIADSGAESWIFRTLTGERDEDGDPEWQDVTFELSRGRLVRVYD